MDYLCVCGGGGGGGAKGMLPPLKLLGAAPLPPPLPTPMQEQKQQ